MSLSFERFISKNLMFSWYHALDLVKKICESKPSFLHDLLKITSTNYMARSKSTNTQHSGEIKFRVDHSAIIIASW